MEELKRNLKSALESDHAGYNLHPENEAEREEFSEKEEVQLATEGLIEEFHDTDEQKDVLKETAERKGDQTMFAHVLAMLLWIKQAMQAVVYIRR